MPVRQSRLQRGFTLIELVIVIVIVGILAAIALPKMTGMSSDARASVMKGVAGSLASANVTLYSAAQIANKMTTNQTLADACGQGSTGVTVSYGYATTITELAKCVNLTPASDFEVVTASGANEIRHKGAPTPADCKVTYTPPASGTAEPAYATTVTGC